VKTGTIFIVDEAECLLNQTRSSATAERQRVCYAHLSPLAHWSCTSL